MSAAYEDPEAVDAVEQFNAGYENALLDAIDKLNEVAEEHDDGDSLESRGLTVAVEVLQELLDSRAG